MIISKEKYNKILKEFHNSKYFVFRTDDVTYNYFMGDLYAFDKENSKWVFVAKPTEPSHPVEVF